MRNTTLIPHMQVAAATIILFLSQMAILAAFMSFVSAATEGNVHSKHDQQRRGNEN
jgi:hypothetical protein